MKHDSFSNFINIKTPNHTSEPNQPPTHFFAILFCHKSISSHLIRLDKFQTNRHIKILKFEISIIVIGFRFNYDFFDAMKNRETATTYFATFDFTSMFWKLNNNETIKSTSHHTLFTIFIYLNLLFASHTIHIHFHGQFVLNRRDASAVELRHLVFTSSPWQIN